MDSDTTPFMNFTTTYTQHTQQNNTYEQNDEGICTRLYNLLCCITLQNQTVPSHESNYYHQML